MKHRTVRIVLSIFLVLSVFSLTDLWAKDSSLSRAYKKEFAFLEAERENLQKRLKTVQSESKSTIRKAEADIVRLQNALLGLSARADDLNERIIDIERQGETRNEALETLEGTLMQAKATLDGYDITLPEPSENDSPEALERTFEKSAKLLMNLRRVRKEKGTFYLSNGTQVSGERIRIGNVASYGISPQGGGALAPAGGGKLKVWETGSLATAKALAIGNPTKLLDIFLYENAEKAIEKKVDKTVKEVIESGGAIAWIIVGMGLAALLMILLRTWFLLRSSTRTDDLVRYLVPLIEQGWRDEALKILKESSGATARVLIATVKNLHEDREKLEDRVSEAILHETPHLERFGAVILVLAAVAPLMGLLGTVTGMISTFDVITEFGTGDPKLLSGGISEALVTTELGLIVAIPTLLFGNLLTGWANRIKTGMEHAALLITNMYLSRTEKRGARDSETVRSGA